VARYYAPLAIKAGAVVVDSTPAWRMDPEVPLVVPEINAADLRTHKGLIASPEGTTVAVAMALYPLHRVNPLKRIVVATYESVSGAGGAALEELSTQARMIIEGRTVVPHMFPHQIAFNVLPEVDVFLDNGYCRGEWKLVEETRKVLHLEGLPITATCVRVPVFVGHAAAVHAEFSQFLAPEEARRLLLEFPGVRVLDDPDVSLYPQPWPAPTTSWWGASGGTPPTAAGSPCGWSSIISGRARPSTRCRSPKSWPGAASCRREENHMAKLGRLLTAMVTPFNDQGGVDEEQAKKLARALLDSGSEGLVVSGTTGESPTLTWEEKLRLFALVRSAIGHRGDLVAGTGSYSTAESIELTREAERLGADAVLLVVPYYNKPTQDGLFAHFRAIAQSTHLPCILYNVPSRTVTSLTADTAIKLSRIENIVGIKEASGNLEQVARILQEARPGFLVWSGNDADTFSILALGGHGVISVASHLVGLQMQDMIQRLLRGDVAGAAALHRHLLPLFNALFIVSNPIPVKYAVNAVGFRVGDPRLPLTPPDEKSAAQIRDTLKRYRIDLAVGVPGRA